MLTAQRLRNALSYDRTTGIFRRKISRWPALLRVPLLTGVTFTFALIDGFIRRAALLALCNRQVASFCNQYINGDRSDIRCANLREATRSQCRASVRSKNKLGARGVWVSKSDRYVAQIRFMGKLKYLESFDTVDEAKAAYEKAAKKHFGEFAQT